MNAFQKRTVGLGVFAHPVAQCGRDVDCFLRQALHKRCLVCTAKVQRGGDKIQGAGVHEVELPGLNVGRHRWVGRHGEDIQARGPEHLKGANEG